MSEVIKNAIAWNEQQAKYHAKEAQRLGATPISASVAAEHERHAIRQYANAEKLKAQL